MSQKVSDVSGTSKQSSIRTGCHPGLMQLSISVDSMVADGGLTGSNPGEMLSPLDDDDEDETIVGHCGIIDGKGAGRGAGGGATRHPVS